MQSAFCVILSKYRLYQGIALYQSLNDHYTNFKMFILCVDHEAYQICNELHLTNAVILKDEELSDERLVAAKQNRKLNEYCWTLKPAFIEYVLNKYDFIDTAIYIDADIYFFNDPSPILKNQTDHCVLLSEHDYIKRNSLIELNCGKYNSGFIVFRRRATSFDALKWWKEKCIAWCGTRVIPGRFGDQKYLEQMPSLFQGVSSITTPGVNIAPWNEKKHKFSIKNQKVLINKTNLICYHFCGFRLINKNSFALLMSKQNAIIYSPYITAIKHSISTIEQSHPGFSGYFVENYFQDKSRIYKLD